jgi:hypothetical protein
MSSRARDGGSVEEVNGIGTLALNAFGFRPARS